MIDELWGIRSRRGIGAVGAVEAWGQWRCGGFGTVESIELVVEELWGLQEAIGA